MNFFLVWLKKLQVFLIFWKYHTCENVKICLSYFLLFYHDHMGHGSIALALCRMQQQHQWVASGVVFIGRIFEGSK